MTIPPLLALLSLESHNPSTDKSDEELQFEKISLTWSTNHPTINPCVPQMNIQQNTKSKKMLHHDSIHIPIYEGEEDPRRHWFVYERMWDATNMTNDDKKISPFSWVLWIDLSSDLVRSNKTPKGHRPTPQQAMK